MTRIAHAHTIGRSLLVIALLLVGAGAMMQEAAAQPSPGGEINPHPSAQPNYEVTRPDLVITAARLGYDSVRHVADLDVVVQNRNFGCSRAAGTFRVSHRTKDHPTTLQNVYVYGDGTTVLHQFQRRLREVGLTKMTLYELRHGHATLQLTHGASLREIMEQLGHTQISTTANVYAPIAPELRRKAAERIDRVFR